MAHNHELYDDGTYFVIDPLTRGMRLACAVKGKVVQHDHNSERFTFVLPRYIDGHDMLKCNCAEVHYQNIEAGTGIKEEGCYRIDDLHQNPRDRNTAVCTWLISRNATKYSGSLDFLLRFACVSEEDTEYAWSTAIYTGVTVSEGFYYMDETVEKYPDVLIQLEARADTLEDRADAMEALTASMTLRTDEMGVRVDEMEVRTDEMAAQIADLCYQPIKIERLISSISTTELGAVITAVTLSWFCNKTPTVLTLDGEEIPVSLDSVTLTEQNIKATKAFTLKATDERGAVATKTTSISFLNGVYYGASEAPETLDSAFVLTLTKILRSNKLPSFSVNAGEGQYIYYCLPTRFGTCSFTVGGFTGGFTLVDTISFTNILGYTEDYYIYRSDNEALGATSVSVG